MNKSAITTFVRKQRKAMPNMDAAQLAGLMVLDLTLGNGWDAEKQGRACDVIEDAIRRYDARLDAH